MKNLLRNLATLVVIAGVISIGISTPTYAVECEDLVISNTGEGSTNIIECETITEVVVECTNNVIVANASFQDSESGEATGSGSVSTGTAVNYNGTNVEVGAECGTTTTPTTPTTPTGATTPPSSTDTPAPVTPTAPQAMPTVLPNTASNPFMYIILGLVTLIIVAIAARTGLALYRHRATK